MKRSRLLIAALALMLPAAVGCGGSSDREPSWNGRLVVDPQPAPALEGTGHTGESFSLGDMAGQVRVVFFGYTFCPDVCPMTLAKLSQVHQALGEDADRVEMIFVSVDPHRDTLEKLAQYVPAFGPYFQGVRVTPEDLGDLTDAWGITVQYGQPKDGPGTDSFYYVDHTGTFFVIDRQGRLRLTYAPDATVEKMVPDLARLAAEPTGLLLVQDAEARATGDAAAVYLTLDNGTNQTDRLLSVSSAQAVEVTLHETMMDNEVMRMAPATDGFVVAAGSRLVLEPGGRHMMLTGLEVPENGRIGLTLHFESSPDLQITVPVAGPGMSMHEGH